MRKVYFIRFGVYITAVLLLAAYACDENTVIEPPPEETPAGVLGLNIYKPLDYSHFVLIKASDASTIIDIELYDEYGSWLGAVESDVQNSCYFVAVGDYLIKLDNKGNLIFEVSRFRGPPDTMPLMVYEPIHNMLWEYEPYYSELVGRDGNNGGELVTVSVGNVEEDIEVDSVDGSVYLLSRSFLKKFATNGEKLFDIPVGSAFNSLAYDAINDELIGCRDNYYPLSGSIIVRWDRDGNELGSFVVEDNIDFIEVRPAEPEIWAVGLDDIFIYTNEGLLKDTVPIEPEDALGYALDFDDDGDYAFFTDWDSIECIDCKERTTVWDTNRFGDVTYGGVGWADD
jgi:hypothetical protein